MVERLNVQQTLNTEPYWLAPPKILTATDLPVFHQTAAQNQILPAKKLEPHPTTTENRSFPAQND